MTRIALIFIALAHAMAVVAGVACTSAILVPVLLPVLGKPSYANCQKDSGVTLSLTGTLPSSEKLAIIGNTTSCVAFYNDVEAAVSKSGVDCTVNGAPVSEFLGTSITSFLINLNAYMGSTTSPPSSGSTPKSTSAATAIALPGGLLVFITAQIWL
ncbi:hypothetical protein ACHHYP_02459 [Achlya hypogyna]|uniref:Elicitin n=1 Tax=Achlya hypogyna TaxID=1202772 RepID=A0A0A7CN34_ACHHY|nr:secreted protein [Achlya hypogyna]OQR93515.1 hypothetical protein ACHHYP_02459 [Achlya hypogyna]